MINIYFFFKLKYLSPNSYDIAPCKVQQTVCTSSIFPTMEICHLYSDSNLLKGIHRTILLRCILLQISIHSWRVARNYNRWLKLNIACKKVVRLVIYIYINTEIETNFTLNIRKYLVRISHKLPPKFVFQDQFCLNEDHCNLMVDWHSKYTYHELSFYNYQIHFYFWSQCMCKFFL